MAKIDLEALEYCGKLPDWDEYLFRDWYKKSEFSQFHNIFTGVKGKTSFVFFGEPGTVGVTCTGCGETPQNYTNNPIEVELNPVCWSIKLRICFDELTGTLAEWQRNSTWAIADIRNTAYFNALRRLINESIELFMWRFWIMKKDAAYWSTSGGYFTEEEGDETLPLDFYNIIDGYWEQIFAAVANGEITNYVQIEANDYTTRPDQKITPQEAYDTIDNLLDGITDEQDLREDSVLLVTRSVYRAYKKYLKDFCCTESSYYAVINGVETVAFEGIPLIPVNEWDYLIKRYQSNSAVTPTQRFYPNRVLYTPIANIIFAVDGMDSFDDVKVIYDEIDDYIYIKLRGLVDSKFAWNKLVSVAY